MASETQSNIKGWTLDTLAVHEADLRESDRRLQRERDRWLKERDRRYAEVKLAEEKALRVKEVADDRALQLAREIQTYKDEKANELRSQIERERGSYASKDELGQVQDKFLVGIAALSERFDAAHKPVLEFMAAQIAAAASTREAKQGFSQAATIAIFVGSLLVGIAAVVVAIVLHG